MPKIVFGLAFSLEPAVLLGAAGRISLEIENLKLRSQLEEPGSSTGSSTIQFYSVESTGRV